MLIVDDDVPTRIGLRSILDSEPDLDVIGESSDGREACNLVDRLGPDVVLMDVRMRPMDGIAATREITGAAHNPDRPRVLVLTTFEHDEYVFGALRAGASGFLLKRAPAEEIVDAIRLVAEGEALLTPEATRRLVADFASQSDAPAEVGDAMEWLTLREREVLVLIARGLTNHEIASSLAVSYETIKTHVKRIFTKIGVHDRAQAVVAAYEARLVAPAD